MLNMYLFVLQQERHGRTLTTLVINNRAQLHACTQLQTHMHTHTHARTHTEQSEVAHTLQDL